MKNEETKYFNVDYDLKEEVEKLEVSEIIKEKLICANIKITLPKKSKDKKNNRLNIYVQAAKEIGGEQRICFLAIEETYIEIMEFKGSRGDRYSGFYNLLLCFLKGDNNFQREGRKLKLDIRYMDQLIKTFNSISDAFENNRCILKDTSTAFSKKIDGEIYEIPIKYYEIIDNNKCEETKEICTFIDEMKKHIDIQCKLLVEGTGDQFINTYKELLSIQKYLEKKLNENKGRKEALEEVRKIKF